MNCAVFASGGGSNFQALIDRKLSGDLHAGLSLLIVNNSGAGAVERANKNGIPVAHCAPSQFGSEEVYAETLRRHFEHYAIDLIVLAGYMKKLPGVIVNEFRNRIVNIHPGLLPAFGGKGMYGSRVHQAVLSYGAKLSGITVHFVDEEYDHGPVIFQAAVPVLSHDTPESLGQRVLELEHTHYWRVIEAIHCGSVKIDGRKVLSEI
jgi:phosphoribosylglycinamide formyltransferase-1